MNYTLIAACLMFGGLALIFGRVARVANATANEYRARYDALKAQAYVRDSKGRIAKAADVL